VRLAKIEPAGRARHEGHACSLHGLPRAGLRSHRLHRGRSGANELDARFDARLREARVFRKEAVAGVDGLGAAAARDIKNLVHVQVGLARRGRADVVGLVGLAHVQGGTVHVGKDGDRADAHLATGANHSHRDLAPVANKDFPEHRA
jgi:hypothetical protein